MANSNNNNNNNINNNNNNNINFYYSIIFKLVIIVSIFIISVDSNPNNSNSDNQLRKGLLCLLINRTMMTRTTKPQQSKWLVFSTVESRYDMKSLVVLVSIIRKIITIINNNQIKLKAPKCGKNAYHTSFCSLSGMKFAPTCNKSSPLVCVPGCDPLPGYVFINGQTGDAVRLKDCPK